MPKTVIFWLLCMPAASGEVLIHELMYHPINNGVEVPAEEYIELFNSDPLLPVDLTGWAIDRGVTFAFPSTNLAPQAYLVIAADVNAFTNRYPGSSAELAGGWTGKLSNSGEEVRLVNALGASVDSVSYSDEGDWARRVRVTLGGETGWDWQSDADGAGFSLELIQLSLSNNQGQNWSPSIALGGSPGLPNQRASTNLPPMIRKVQHLPAVPNFADPVSVSARLTDEGSNLTATVHWRLSTLTPGGFSQAFMSEGAPGEFAAVLPPQAEDSVIEFYLSASDGTQTRTWPAPTDQGQVANLFYVVDSTPGLASVATYRAVMSAIDKDPFLDRNEYNRNSDALQNITFIVQGGAEDVVRYQAGVRIRGNSSRTYNPPPMRINLPADDPWGKQTRLNVNSRYPWLQFVGNHFMSLSGVKAPDAKRVNFRLNEDSPANNDGVMRGSYVHLQPIGEEYVADKYPDDDAGNLYKKRSASGNRDEKRWGVHFDTEVVYTNAQWYIPDRWSKLTNDGEDDWSDLQTFVETMHQASGTGYYDQVAAIVDIDQWVKWFAGMTLLNSYETNLSNGIDDDYSMYRGFKSGRFELIPHDLDTIFGEGDTGSSPADSIFPFLTLTIPRAGEAGRIPQLVPFFEHPEIRQRYFAEIRSLLADEYSKDHFDARMQNVLGDWVTQGDINGIINYMDQRRIFLSDIVNASLSVDNNLPVLGNFPRTTVSTISLNGALDPTSTASVQVNGQAASLDLVNASWILPGLQLFPGINHVTVVALDELGQTLSEEIREIWYDDGTTNNLSGQISTTLSLDPNQGPYRVSGDVVVAVGGHLNIPAGTSLFFDEGMTLTVNGSLSAVGSPNAHVYCGPIPNAPFVPDPAGNGGLPDGPPKWGGIQFVDTMSGNNFLTYTDVHHAQDENGSVGAHRSQVVLDHMRFSGTHIRMVYADRSSVAVLNSTFPDMFSPSENADALGLDNISEHIKGEGAYPTNGFFVIRGNHFGTNKGHNDVIDVDSGRRPDPILQILDNVFTGAGDEELDLGGDVYVAGNLFMNVNKDDETSDRGYANAISTGDSGSDTLIVVSRNIFWDIDHAINLKIGTSTIFENNTVVKVHPDFNDRFGNPNIASAINLYVDEPGAQPGDGAYAGNNIFVDCPRIFGNADQPDGNETSLELDNNLMVATLAEREITSRIGTALALDPETRLGTPNFIDELRGQFDLLPGSPAIGAGSAGQDLGARIPEGIFIAGEPPEITTSGNARLTVGGPGIFAYTYRVNSGPWSAELPIGSGFDPSNGTVRSAEINLVGLVPGTYQVDVRGVDFAGNQQSGVTRSRAWTVDPNYTALRINEVLASNAGAVDHAGSQPDLIELYNPGIHPIDLGGKQLSDDPAVPGKFVFGPGTAIAGGEYLVLFADRLTALPGIHLGFSLDVDGEGVYLYDSVADGGALLDSVHFGLQLDDRSIGRTGPDADTWALTFPTFGEPNQAHPYGDPRQLRINEWLATAEVRLEEDFVELYNADDYPVALGGLFLTDAPQTRPDRHEIAPLSFVAGNGFAVFHASGSADPDDARLLKFKLSARNEWLGLNDALLNPIDLVNFQCEVTDISAGRLPDGALSFSDFTFPTPGTHNDGPDSTVEVTTLVTLPATWAYEQSNTDLGSAWIAPAFNDATWPRGPALLYQESGQLNGPAGTLLNLNPPTTHYFRHAFNFSGNRSAAEWEYDLFADDGAVVYLNGVELNRHRMPDGAISHSSFANAGVGNANREGPFAIPASFLRDGNNTLAVSVHQDDGTSGDVVFGLELRSSETSGVASNLFANTIALADGLRITEIMYHPENGLAEFIEFQNISPRPLELGGVRLRGGTDFDFPAMTLGPGAYVLVVRDLTTFTATYGSNISVAGTYSDPLDNGGAQITVLPPNPYDAAILRFRFDDAWYPQTDGSGSSLEILNAQAPVSTWGASHSWRASIPGGSPAQIAAPVITSPLVSVGRLGDFISYQMTATQNPISYIASGLPSGLSIDTQSGIISGTPLVYGDFMIRLQANNVGGPGFATLNLSLAASGPFVGYAWDPIGNPQPLLAPIPVTLKAVDAQGRTVVGHQGVLDLSGLAGASAGPVSTLLITECWDNSPDYIEIQNVSSASLDTLGWVVAVNDADWSGVNDANSTLWALPASIPAGQVLYRTDDQADNYFGSNILWSHGRFFPSNNRHGWAMIVDDQGALVDFVAWGYNANEISSINLTVNGFNMTVGDQWVGNGVSWNSAGSRALLRNGDEDLNSAAEWSWTSLSRGSENAGLTVPFTGGALPISISPASSNLVNGLWSSTVTINELADQMVLLANDGGAQAVSIPFDVVIPPAPVITSAAIIIAVQGQPFGYRIVADNGPTSFGAQSLPGGVNVDPGSGVLTGMLSTAGPVNFNVLASNAGGTGSRQVTLTVQADTDGDGMPDDWENANGLNASVMDGHLDRDLDRQSNLNEFLSETDPDDPSSVFRGVQVIQVGNDAQVQWASVVGRQYRVLVSLDLANWTVLPDSEMTASGTLSSFTHVDAVTGRRIYYRIETFTQF